jgi:uncharacterized membrane protein
VFRRYNEDVNVLFAGGLTVASVLWLVALVGAPVALGQDNLGGAVAFLYAAASQICHQRPDRSFALAGMQLPVCARCVGLYFSGALGAAAVWLAAPGALPQGRLILAAAAVPTGVTWALEAAGLMGFSNLTRAVAALPLGAAAGWVIVQMLRYDAESHGREIHDSRPSARLG